MIKILLIGLGLLVLGLNLIMIWYILTKTTASIKSAEEKIKKKSIGVTIAGALVMTVGIFRYFGCVVSLTANPTEGFAILIAGEQVALLGLAQILAVIARENDKYVRCIKEWARIIVEIGAVLILVYGIIVYVCPLFCE